MIQARSLTFRHHSDINIGYGTDITRIVCRNFPASLSTNEKLSVSCDPWRNQLWQWLKKGCRKPVLRITDTTCVRTHPSNSTLVYHCLGKQHGAYALSVLSVEDDNFLREGWGCVNLMVFIWEFSRFGFTEKALFQVIVGLLLVYEDWEKGDVCLRVCMCVCFMT